MVNIFGLSVVFACLLISYSYVKKELSYDRYNEHADRIARLTLQYDNNPVDGRLYGNNLQDILRQTPGIEQVIRLSSHQRNVLAYQDKMQVVDNVLYVSANFFEVFTVPLLEGEASSVLQSPLKDVVVSEEFARNVFGTEQAVGKELHLKGARWEVNDCTLFVTGVCKKMPETSHFHSDVLICQPEQPDGYNYTYLLLKEGEGVQLSELEQKLTQEIAKNEQSETVVRAILTPITDIHLHSRNLREIEPNGNISFIYLIIGANILLLSVVLFNLWMNSSLIFSSRRRYHCILRINGASTSDILKQEGLLSAFLAGCSFILGAVWVYLIVLQGYFSLNISYFEACAIGLVFLLLIVSVSLIPVFTDIASTLFLNIETELKPAKFSYANVKYPLMSQYVVVMLAVILAFGIVRQMNMVKNTQTGGGDPDIVVLEEQPEQVRQRYELLKTELQKYPQIKSVTACFQTPGDAIRDYVSIVSADGEKISIPLMIAGGDFIPFFHIQLEAGRTFFPNQFTYNEELNLVSDFLEKGKKSGYSEEYMINRKAMEKLGYASSEEAVGQSLKIEHGTVDYIDNGVICGVTDDFNYTGLHNPNIPLIIMQRSIFYNCIFIRIDPEQTRTALNAVHQAWQEVNPELPVSYTFMQDIFHNTYRNELYAERLVLIFSFLCLVIVNTGLIVFMNFIVKRRTKEVGIRKINGAERWEIVALLNAPFLRWMALAFLIAVPAAYLIFQHWLQNFAYKAPLSWWVFASAGVATLTLSALSVSVQSWRAATANPVDAIKSG